MKRADIVDDTGYAVVDAAVAQIDVGDEIAAGETSAVQQKNIIMNKPDRERFRLLPEMCGIHLFFREHIVTG